MEEIKDRQAIISSALDGQLNPFLQPRAIEELCYLQLRMTCELIALGCLLMHGDIEATRSGKIAKRYEADWILNALSKIHPAFYPRPSKQLGMIGKVRQVEAITSGYLTKADLVALYHECGSNLHRGSIRRLLSKDVVPLRFDLIRAWQGKIITLLNHHQIDSMDPLIEYWVLMKADHDGKAHAHVMQKLV